MIYLVTRNLELFQNDLYKIISVEESLDLMKDWTTVQYDSETDGKDAHINMLLCAQFGNKKANIQIVVDTLTIDISLYKDILESKFVIGHNLKFDLQFLYNYGIVPRRVYDTMIVEQVIYLGYPKGIISYSLKEVACRRLNIDIDKTVRGEIIWRGLDASVVKYAAGDVEFLEDIMQSQYQDLVKKDLIKAAKLECDFVPSISYLEWCGIKLSIPKWTAKMKQDKKNLNERMDKLNQFILKNKMSKYYTIDRQGDLFSGFNTDPIVTINWDSPKQVTQLCKELGFNTTVPDKKTDGDKDSILEKHLKSQKGINDEFLDIYFDYRESAKVCSTYGQGHLNAINPKTGRIHTTYWQLGAASGRMSCGSNNPNTDLAKLNKVSPKDCTYPK